MISDIKEATYSITRLGSANMKDLEELFRAVYDKEAPKGYFRKKYDTAYTGAEYIGYLAFNKENIPIAFYGVVPCFLQCGDAVILSAQSVDTMTHPKHRYKGMFVALSKMTFGLCTESGIRLIFGFPNQHSYHGAIEKLGWKRTETMSCFSIDVLALPLYLLSEKFVFLKKWYENYAERLLKKYKIPVNGISHSANEEGWSGLLRNDPFLKYKTYQITHVVQAGKAKAWVSIGDALIIGDLLLEGGDFDSAIRALKKIASRLGLRKIYFHSSPGTALHQLFALRYKSISSFPVLFQDLGSGTDLARIKFTFADIDIF